MLKNILVSIVVSGLVSFGIMKFQMRMIEKWMDDFFKKERDFIKRQLRTQSLYRKTSEKAGDE